MQLIERLGEPENIIALGGSDLPAPSVVEDDDGIRWLLLPADGDYVRPPQWASAAAAGVIGLARPHEHGWRYLSAEDFIAGRQESMGDYRLPDFSAPLKSFPTAVDLFAEPADPSDVTGFVHLHTHSEYSFLDGLSNLDEIATCVKGYGQQAFAVTDHGNVMAHPELQKVADKHGLRPLFGIEAYLIPDRLERPPKSGSTGRDGQPVTPEFAKAEQARLRRYWHLILIAKNDVGLRNLWAASTEAYRDGYYHKPRMDWDTLRRHREGLIATTACLGGPLSRDALSVGNYDVARQRLGQLMDIFGEDLYVELQPGHGAEQIAVNERLVELAREYGVPLVAAGDSHYPAKDDYDAHQVWLSIQQDKDVATDSSLFNEGEDYHLMTEEEIRAELAYLPADAVDEAVANTTIIANQCTARIDGKPSTPIYTRGGTHGDDSERLLDICLNNWHLVHGKTHPVEVYEQRLQYEFGVYLERQLCGYVLMVEDMCRYARNNNILVGPGRGSACGSLVSYLTGITGIDPVECDLMFERFLVPGRISYPDFDLDFPQSKKKQMQQYAFDRWGEDHVAVVGSITRLRSKGVVEKLGKALDSRLPEGAHDDLFEVRRIIKDAEADTAGLGYPWEDLWTIFDDQLGPYRRKYPEFFAYADRMVGRASTVGQHAAGLIISTDVPLTGRLPMRRPGKEDDGERMVAQFDYRALEELGFIKLDVLTLRTLDTIQMTIDLARERRGVEIDMRTWRGEYADPQVWEQVAAGHTLGMFQIETTAGTKLTKRLKPASVEDLCAIMALGRPGPMRSGLTETFLKRRAGLEPVSVPDERLAEVLGRTYGCIVYQEQVMAVTQLLAGYDTGEADSVRKILGKKLVEKIGPAGVEFVSRAVANGTDKSVAEHLWEQMAEFARYAFNRSHAYAYAVLAYWTGWLKNHYPLEFSTALMSTVDKERIPEFVKETQRFGYQVLPPDVNESKLGFTPTDLAIRYGLDAVKNVAEASATAIVTAQPFKDWPDFTERKGKANASVVGALASVGAFDSLVPNRRGLITLLERTKDGTESSCALKDLDFVGVNGLPCHYDWASEPPPVSPKTGKKLKPKAIPTACRGRACRQFRPREAFDPDAVEPYTEREIREIEQEMLGCYLSSTPFDDIAPEYRPRLREDAELLTTDGPAGVYYVGGVVTKVKPHITANGRRMGFVALETEFGLVDVTVFNDPWDQFHRDLKVGRLVIAELRRDGRGNKLVQLQPVL